MKARFPSAGAILNKMNNDAAVRMALIAMITLNEVYGFGAERLKRFDLKFNENIDEFWKGAEGGCGDELLFRRCEEHGIPVPDDIKEDLLRTEKLAFQIGLTKTKGAWRCE